MTKLYDAMNYLIKQYLRTTIFLLENLILQ